jgi:hypothetical protein
MVRNGHRIFDQYLEGARSLGAVLIAASFILPQQGKIDVVRRSPLAPRNPIGEEKFACLPT